MDEERTSNKRNGREKEVFELAEVTRQDPVLQSVVDSWNLLKPVDIMMAERMVSIWKNIKEMETKIKQQGIVVGVLPKIQAHPLLPKLNDLHTQLLSIYKTFEKRMPDGDDKPTDFAEWIEKARK